MRILKDLFMKTLIYFVFVYFVVTLFKKLGAYKNSSVLSISVGLTLGWIIVQLFYMYKKSKIIK